MFKRGCQLSGQSSCTKLNKKWNDEEDYHCLTLQKCYWWQKPYAPPPGNNDFNTSTHPHIQHFCHFSLRQSFSNSPPSELFISCCELWQTLISAQWHSLKSHCLHYICRHPLANHYHPLWHSVYILKCRTLGSHADGMRLDLDLDLDRLYWSSRKIIWTLEIMRFVFC